ELEKLKRQKKEAHDAAESPRNETTHENQNAHTNRTNLLNTVSTPLSAASPSRAFNDGEPSYLDDPSTPHLEDIYASPSEGIFTDSSYDDKGVVTDFNNLETTVNVSPTPTTRIHTIHPKTQILGDPMLAIQTRSKVIKNFEAHALKVWILIDLPFGKKAIGTKWVYRNKKDERGVVVRNKERLVAQGHRQEEGIDYDEVFTPMARIQAVRIFLAFASYMGFIVSQMDVKSAFLYGTIDEEAYVTQPPGFEILSFLISVKTVSTPIETQKPLVKDEEAANVNVYLYIVDFLNTQDIQYALMVNPTIYVSCIKQFWATVSIKKVNDVVKLRSLINGKRVVVTEDIIRQALCLDDANGCKEDYVERIQLFNGVYCHLLATDRKFNFSKCIFDSMYTSPALTQKVFANMHRVGKGFFGVETPLFATMLVQPQPPTAEEEDEEEEVPNAPTSPSPTTAPSPLMLRNIIYTYNIKVI
nr:putative ribonuclease H-like domain-containing protein [Tanacetum cinerariifolium]